MKQQSNTAEVPPDRIPIPALPFIVDPEGNPDLRCFWRPPVVSKSDFRRSGIAMARAYAREASQDPVVAMMFATIVEEMAGVKSGALAGTQASAFLSELIRVAAQKS